MPGDQVSACLFALEAQEFSDLLMLINLHLKHEMPRNCIYQILPRQQRLVFRAHAQAKLVLIFSQGTQSQPIKVHRALHGRLLLIR